MDWTQIWQMIGLPVASGLLGWFQNAAQDGQFSKYEVVKGIETIIKLGVPATAGWLALNGFGVDVEAWAVAAIPIALYWLYKIFKLPQTTTAVSSKKKE